MHYLTRPQCHPARMSKASSLQWTCTFPENVNFVRDSHRPFALDFARADLLTRKFCFT
jgi:hypothetical protein